MALGSEEKESFMSPGMLLKLSEKTYIKKVLSCE
jgi:hypothetical protein